MTSYNYAVYFMCSTQALSQWHTGLCASVLFHHVTIITTQPKDLEHPYSQGRKIDTPCSALYVTVTWMSAAHITCPGPVSTVQTLASVEDELKPSLTWQSSGLCKSLIWHSCLTLNGVFLLTWQPFSQCYDCRLFMLCGAIREMHI